MKPFFHPLITKSHFLFTVLISISIACATVSSAHEPAYINSYPPNVYKASPTVYNMAIDNEGMLFFATNKGVLIFDGTRWELIGISNYSDAKTIEVGPDGKVYVGATDNFGYLEKDVHEGYKYVSMSDSLPADMSEFNDVWQIVFLNGNIYFQSYVGLFKWDGTKINFTPIEEIYIFNINNQLYASNYLTGEFGRYEDGKIDHISAFPRLQDELVFQVMDYDASRYILATSDYGLFLFDPKSEQITQFNSEVHDFMVANKFWEGIKVAPNLYAMGSWDGGLAFTDANGNDLHVFDQTSGLNANHIYDLKVGLNNDLWLATSNGISRVSLDSMIDQLDKQPSTLSIPQIRNITFQTGEEISKTNIFAGAQFEEKDKKYSVKDRNLSIFIPPATLSIYYAAPQFAGEEVAYSVYMEGYDRNWSAWKEEAIKEYTNLPEGRYRFYVQARKASTNELSKINSFDLHIIAPWYQSAWIKVLIAVLILLAIGIVSRLMILRLKTQNVRLEKIVNERTQNLMEQQLKLSDLNQHLQNTNSELDSFVYHTSHDLKAPLKSVLGLLNLAKKEDTDRRFLPYHERIEKSIHKLEEFISSIIQYSTNSKSSVDINTIDFNILVENSLTGLQFHEDFEKIEISRDIKVNGSFQSDEKRIQIILNNLLSNAIKYHDKKKSEHKITITVRQDDDSITMVVEDNGIGIKPEMQQKVFSMFYRASEKSYGSGLGLYIISETVAKLNGSIDLQSEEGQFSRFIIILPNVDKRAKIRRTSPASMP